MPIVFLDGMEDNSSWTNNGGVQIVPARNGKGVHMDRDGYIYYHGVTADLSTMTVGFAYRPLEFLVGTNVIFSIIGYGVYSSGNISNQPQIYFTQGIDGSISVRNFISGIIGTTAAAALSLGTWSFLEVQAKCHLNAGTCIIRVNNTQVLSLSNIRTIDDTYCAAGFNGLQLGDVGDANEAMYDDLYIAGGDNEAFYGDLVIETLYPSGNGAVNEWRGNDGNTVDNYLLVNEVGTPSGSGYVRTSINDQRDIYQLSNLATLAAGIVGVDHSVHIGRDSDTPAQMRMLSRGNSDTATEPLTVNTGSHTQHFALATNPETGSAWTVAEVNALQTGIQYVDPTVIIPASGVIVLLESFNDFVVPLPAVPMALTYGQSFSSVTLNKPDGIIAGDLLIMCLAVDTAATPVLTPAWTQVGFSPSPTGPLRLICLARLAAAGTSAETWTLSGAAEDFIAGVHRVTGHGVTDVSTLPIVFANSYSYVDTPTLSVPTRSTRLWYNVGAYDNAAATDVITGVAPGYTAAAVQQSSSTTTSISMGVGYKVLNEFSENAGDWSAVTSPYRTWSGFAMAVPGAVTPWTSYWFASGTSPARSVPGRTGVGVEMSGVGSWLCYRIPPANESKHIVVGCAFRATVDTNNVRTILELCSDTDLMYGSPDIYQFAPVTHLVLGYSGATGRFFVFHGSMGGAVLSNSAVGLLPFNTWGYIEMAATLHDSNGRFEVRLNGTKIMSMSYGDTRNGGQKGVFDTVRLTVNSNGDTGQWDDMYVRTNGNTFRGDIPIP